MVALFPYILPFLKGWRYHVPKVSGPVTVGAGRMKVLSEVEEPGFALSYVFVLDNPRAEVNIRYYDPVGNVMSYRFTPEELYVRGVSVSGLPSVTLYDTANNVYTVAFVPQPPIAFYSERAPSHSVILRAPDNSSVTLIDYRENIIVIEDPDEFISSLRAILR